MTTSILYELFNNTLRGGTGIATYARNLTRTAKELGYRAEGLFHTTRALSNKDPILAEVEFFDARKTGGFDFSKHVLLSRSWALGAPGGIATKRLPRTGVVIAPDASRDRADEEMDNRNSPRASSWTFHDCTSNVMAFARNCVFRRGPRSFMRRRRFRYAFKGQ